MDLRATELQHGPRLQQWITAADIAADDLTRTWQWGTGQKSMIIRLILLALGHTAACTRSVIVSTGPDQLALLSGAPPEAALAAVQTLLSDNDPLIVPAPHPAPPTAPACWLRIPQNYREAAEWRRFRAGSLTPTHPVFLALGPAAGFTYDSLRDFWQPARDITSGAKLSYTTTNKALKSLQDYRLAVSQIVRPTQWDRPVRCWRPGPATPDEVAEAAGAADSYQRRLIGHGGNPDAVCWPYIPGLISPEAVMEMAP